MSGDILIVYITIFLLVSPDLKISKSRIEDKVPQMVSWKIRIQPILENCWHRILLNLILFFLIMCLIELLPFRTTTYE